MTATAPHHLLHLLGDVRLAAIAASIALAAIVLAWRTGYLTRGGFVAALLVGVPTAVAFSWAGFALLAFFFLGRDAIAGHAARRSAKKHDEPVPKYVAKDFGAIFLSGFLPLAAAGTLVLSATAGLQHVAIVFFLASLATPFGDWPSTEFGKAYGRETFQIITFERVRSGSRGGVSREGSLFGGGAIVLFAAVALALFVTAGVEVPIQGLETPELNAKTMVIVVMAAALANFVESVIAGIFSQFQRSPNKQLLCFVGSVIGGALAVSFTNLPAG